MAVTEHPDAGLPSNAQTVMTEWAPDTGETRTEEWKGAPGDIAAQYTAQQSASGIRGITKRIAEGRATLICRFERTDSGQPESVVTIEELYAQDVVRPIEYAPYFTTAATKIADDDISWVLRVVEEQWEEAKITTEGDALGRKNWAAWTDPMKELRYHLNHGVQSYLETTFTFARSRYGIRTSQMQATFSDINTVVTAPVFSTSMDAIVATLPDGEWLKRSPRVTHMGKGRWQVQEEWIYAAKISVVYGGTWGKDN